MVKQFIKDSFKNGNRFTNIGITIIMILLGIIGFIAQKTYDRFEVMSETIYRHEIRLQVIDEKIANMKEDAGGKSIQKNNKFKQ